MPWGVTNCGYGCRMMSSYVVVAVGAQRGSVSDVPKFLEEKRPLTQPMTSSCCRQSASMGNWRKLAQVDSSGTEWHSMAHLPTENGCNGATQLTSIDCLLPAVCICVPVPFIPAV